MKPRIFMKRLKIALFRTVKYLFRYTPLALILALSCTEEETNTIDPKLQPYVTTFLQEAKAHNTPIHIHQYTIRLQPNLTLNGQPVNATCTNYSSGKSVIYIDTDYYNTSAPMCIERTLFHELGHSLGRSHTNTRSVMNTMDATLRCYGDSESLRQELINELFTHLPQ
jgi:hypothetical protein